MPHVVLKGPVTVEDVWIAFQPQEFREGGVVFKASDAYLGDDKKSLLVRSLVVERNFPKNFFLRLAQREDEITINLEPLAGPERTEAVKRFIGWCAWQITFAEPETQIVATNIREHIRPPSEAGA